MRHRRRPVASVALVLLAASVLVFWQADTVALIMIARVIQGVASGLLSAVSAAIIDFEPLSRPGSAAAWTAVAPMLGLGNRRAVPVARCEHRAV